RELNQSFVTGIADGPPSRVSRVTTVADELWAVLSAQGYTLQPTDPVLKEACMFRLSRGVCLITVLTLSAVVLSTLPAGAQTREGLLLGGKASGNTAFLTAG